MKFYFLNIILPFLLSILTGCKSSYTPEDYELFRNTPVWDLAKAVRSNDTTEIKLLVNEIGLDINYREPIYGYTVMMTALQNSRSYFHQTKKGTLEALLQLGADPNIYSNPSRGENSVIIACSENLAESLGLLLKYGGDPNSVAKRKGRWKNHDTALITAINSLKNPQDTRTVMLLLDAGADINGKNESTQRTAIDEAMMGSNLKLVLALLKKGADFTGPFHSLSYVDETGNLKDVSILQALRIRRPKLDSQDYSYKKEIIDFLKDKGLDYYSTPIPESVVRWAQKEYPDSWQDYLKKY